MWCRCLYDVVRSLLLAPSYKMGKIAQLDFNKSMDLRYCAGSRQAGALLLTNMAQPESNEKARMAAKIIFSTVL
jgi:hypothetical protein